MYFEGGVDRISQHTGPVGMGYERDKDVSKCFGPNNWKEALPLLEIKRTVGDTNLGRKIRRVYLYIEI